MSVSHRVAVVSSLVVLCALTGCQVVPKSDYNRAQAQLRDIKQQNLELQRSLVNSTVHGEELANQLSDAENQLDSLASKLNIDRRKLANYKNERNRLGRLASLGSGSLGGSDQDQSLAKLCKQFPGLRYDSELGIAKVENDIFYRTGSAELSKEGKQLLAVLVSIVEAPETKNYKILLAGHTDDRMIRGREVRSKYPTNWHLSSARAQSVLSYLLHRGLDKERFALASYGMQQPVVENANDQSRQINRRVEIFLLPVDVRVAGWPETIPTIYR